MQIVTYNLGLLGSGYFILRKNTLCEDENKLEINSENDCKGAAEFIRYYAGVKLNKGNVPKGCYLGNGGVWFNKHRVGSRQADSSPICIMNGKYEYSTIKILEKLSDNTKKMKIPYVISHQL